jgi:hypothetical protein
VFSIPRYTREVFREFRECRVYRESVGSGRSGRSGSKNPTFQKPIISFYGSFGLMVN